MSKSPYKKEFEQFRESYKKGQKKRDAENKLDTFLGTGIARDNARGVLAENRASGLPRREVQNITRNPREFTRYANYEIVEPNSMNNFKKTGKPHINYPQARAAARTERIKKGDTGVKKLSKKGSGR